MIIAITGGTGFIGQALVHKHIAAGDTVRILSRRTKSILSFSDTVTCIQGDLTSSNDSLQAFTRDADILYHCAGEIQDMSKMHAVHVDGTRILCKAAAGNIGRWVQLSSVGAYGPHQAGIVTEETPENPVGIYETSKTVSDQIVRGFAREGAFTCAVLRPANVFGPDMRNQSLFQLINMIYRGLFFFIGKAGAAANYIHVDNVVEGLVRCGTMNAAANRVYNLSDSCPLEEFISMISKALHKPVPTLRLPEGPVRLLARVGGCLPGFPLTSSRIDALTGRAGYSVNRIQHELGYLHPLAMEEAVKQTVIAWREKNHV